MTLYGGDLGTVKIQHDILGHDNIKNGLGEHASNLSLQKQDHKVI